MITVSTEITKPTNVFKFEVGKVYDVLKNKRCCPMRVTKREHKNYKDYITIVSTSSPTKTEYEAEIKNGVLLHPITKSENITWQDTTGSHTLWACDKIDEE